MSKMMLRPRPLTFATSIAACVLSAAPALAVVNFEFGAGSGLADLTTCDAGLIWDRENGACVEARQGALPDEALSDYALALIKSERFEEALATLDLREVPDDAKALNYRGYATRKLGRIDESITYYLKAVTLAPRYVEVREYLGEAYIAQGRIDLAEQQLVIIETLCGTSCEEYSELAQAIEAAR
jgi:tetratricopeptide (TPR) repeat protein